MEDKPSLDNNGQVLPPTDPFSVLNVLHALAQTGLGGTAGGAMAASDLAARVAQARNRGQNQAWAPNQNQGVLQPSQRSQSGSGGSFTDWLADKIYGRTPPPTWTPPAPGVPRMKGVNPVSGETLFSHDPKGEAGHERPGVGGAGNFDARRGNAEHRRPHHGEDISGPLGANIHAATDGTVIFSGVNGSATTGYGNMVVIDNGNGTVTRYAHNRDNLVRVGDRVKQGDVIATLGRTGNASKLDPSERHLHFEVEEDGQLVDPATWLNSVFASRASASASPTTPAAQPKPGAKRAPAPSRKQ